MMLISKKNNLSAQLHLSLFACLHINKAADLMFKEQHRINSDICQMISSLLYHDKLQNASEVLNNLTSDMIRTVNIAWYNINSTVVFFNVANSTVTKSFDKSFQNLKHAAVTMNLVKKLLDSDISPKQILILVLYQFQYHLYLQVQLKLQVKHNNSKIHEIYMHKIDEFQEEE